MHSTMSPYIAVNRGNSPPTEPADNHPVQIYTYSRHTGVVTTQPGAVVVNEAEDPPDYLGLAACSVCLCWMIGLLAVSYSFESKKYAMSGNYARASESGKSARITAVAAILIGLVITVTMVAWEFMKHSNCSPNC
ncbi:trafficking regulator of GLUT4 1-like [Haliotis cracherodii]|uniref:trafficking regulator of GLUT4 1-like n=1 Tax=Haliotis cracherodii TaxID=6455 RepID=UPI0039EA3FAF